MTNIIQVRVQVENDTAAGLAESKASIVEAGTEAAGGFSSAFTEGIESGTGGVSMLGSRISALLGAGIAEGSPEVEEEVDNLLAQVLSQLPGAIDPDATYAGLQIGESLTAAFMESISDTAGVSEALASMGALSAEEYVQALQGGFASSADVLSEIGFNIAEKISTSVEESAVSMEPAAAEAGASVGAAFVSGIGEGIYAGGNSNSLATSAIYGWFGRLQPEVEAEGTELGLAFSASFSESAQAGLAAADAESAVSTGLEDVAKSADKATSSVGGLSSMMYGPLGMAMYAIMAVGPMVVGWLENISGVGDHTTISANTLTEAFLNVSTSTDQLNPGVVNLAAGLGAMSDTLGGGAVQGLQDMDSALSSLYSTNPELATSEFDQMSNAMQAAGVSASTVASDFPKYTQAVDSAKEATQEQIIELAQMVPGTQVFTDAVSKQTLSLQQNAATALVNATALNNSLAPQSQLSNSAITASLAYNQATTATGAYTSALNSLYGMYGNTSQAEASLTTDLIGLTGQITKGTDAVNLNTDAGAKNFTAFDQVANQAETYAEKLYTQTQNSGLATQALQESVTALDKAASHAGLTTTQISLLNTELFGVPKAKDITFTTNASQVQGQIQGLINTYDNVPGGVGPPIYPQQHAIGGITGAAANGGSQYGGPTLMNEQGPEVVNLPNGSQVMPAANTASMMANGIFGGGGSIQLEWIGGPSDQLGQVMFTWFRNNIRIRGGNVQKVLGTS